MLSRFVYLYTTKYEYSIIYRRLIKKAYTYALSLYDTNKYEIKKIIFLVRLNLYKNIYISFDTS